MSFAKYPAYKDSGVEWLGEVPEHWETWKVSHAFGSVGSGTTPPSNEAQWYDEVGTPWVTTGELRENVINATSKSVTSAALEKFTALRVHPAGSLVMAMYGATIGRLGILGVDATTNQACCVLSAPKHLNVAFTYYWLQGFKQTIIDIFSTGGGQPNINQDVVASLRIPAPNFDEQTVIATFLDHETAKIDALVAEQEKLIALLQEKRQAVISHAVTKGLDPNVPMKDSGVEWLGEVPAHWIATKLSKLVTKIGDGLHGTPVYVDDSEFRFINGNNLSGGSISFTDSTRCVSEEEFKRCRIQLDGTTVLLSINGTIGNVALYKSESVILGKSAAYINCGDQLSREFLYWFLQSSQIGLYFDYSITGTTIFNLSLESIRRMPIAVPPIDEQMEIVQRMRERIGNYDGLLAQAQRAIDLLQERRTALISAAVTGQIDVRGLAGSANAPD